MMKFKGKKGIAFLMTAIFVMSLFVIGGSAVAQDDENVIKIGAVYPLSGSTAQNGETQRKAHEFAVKKINEAGGIEALGGAKIEMVYADSQSKPEVGMAEAERLITNENVVALMGTFESHVGLAVQDVAEKYDVPFIVCNALSDIFVEKDMDYTFKTVINLSQIGEDSVNFARNTAEANGDSDDVKTAAMLYGDFHFGHEVARFWKEYLPKKGFEIVADIAYPVPSKDMYDSILKLKSAKPDVLFSLGNISDSTLIMQTMKELNYYPEYAMIGVGGGFTETTFFDNVGDLAEGLYMVNDWLPNINMEGAQELNSEFKEEYGREMTGNANSTYAAMWVLKDALERAGSTDGEDLRVALENTDITSGPVTFMYNRVKFDEDGMNISAQNVVGQVQDGEKVVVWPEDKAVAEPVWPVPNWQER